MTPQDFEKLEAAIKMQSFAKFFTDEDYEQFKKVFKERGFKKGQKILWRGQKGFFFFIIGTGKISVRVTGEDKKEKIVAHLKPGDFVGEISLLYNRPRVADCYAEEDNTLLFLLANRPFFDVFVAKPEVRAALEEIAQSRMAQTKKISTDSSEPGEKTEVQPSVLVPDIPPLEPIAPEEIKLSPTKTREEKKKPEPILEVEPPPPAAGVLPAVETSAEPEPPKPLPVEESILLPEEGIIFPDTEPVMNEVDLPAAEMPVPEVIKPVDALKAMFCKPDEDVISRINSLCREKSLKSGEMMSMGEKKAFVIVSSGEVNVKDTLRNMEMSLSQGSFFGDLPLVFPVEARFEYKAAADSTLLVMDAEESLKTLLELPGVKEELEVKAIRRICSSPFRSYSSEPAVEKHLTDLFRQYSVAFCA